MAIFRNFRRLDKSGCDPEAASEPEFGEFRSICVGSSFE
jgi:hypothetical protein